MPFDHGDDALTGHVVLIDEPLCNSRQVPSRGDARTASVGLPLAGAGFHKTVIAPRIAQTLLPPLAAAALLIFPVLKSLGQQKA